MSGLVRYSKLNGGYTYTPAYHPHYKILFNNKLLQSPHLTQICHNNSYNVAKETLHVMELYAHSGLDKVKHTREKNKFGETNPWNISGKRAQNKETRNQQRGGIQLITARFYSNHP